jgi:hypothetical protein
MDILNFISWIRGRRQVTSVDPAKTLLPVGLKDGRRDDEYLAGAISVEDLAAQIAPEPAYKVYTALLTQSGGDDLQSQNSGSLTIGRTYFINSTPSLYGSDFTNVGAPNNNTGTYFVATGTTPNWGINPDPDMLTYNTGAPVVTVLENTIGNIYYQYNGTGNYSILTTNSLFTANKTYSVLQLWADDGISPRLGFISRASTSELNMTLTDTNGNPADTLGAISNPVYLLTSIEIRVYN